MRNMLGISQVIGKVSGTIREGLGHALRSLMLGSHLPDARVPRVTIEFAECSKLFQCHG